MTTNLPPLSDEAKIEAARLVAAKFLRLADGCLNDPQTWSRVSARLGCVAINYHVPGGGRGEYAPANSERGGIIAINTAYLPEEQARAWVHELAHHEVHHWIPPQLPGAADIYSYGDNPHDVRHQIARQVETFVFTP